MTEPLAVKLRPSSIDDVFGQTHLIGPGKIIRNMVTHGRIFSMILYGKPGIGKTTIAEAIVKSVGLKYRMLRQTGFTSPLFRKWFDYFNWNDNIESLS